jgi:hypothetical protein
VAAPAMTCVPANPSAFEDDAVTVAVPEAAMLAPGSAFAPLAVGATVCCDCAAISGVRPICGRDGKLRPICGTTGPL